MSPFDVEFMENEHKMADSRLVILSPASTLRVFVHVMDSSGAYRNTVLVNAHMRPTMLLETGDSSCGSSEIASSRNNGLSGYVSSFLVFPEPSTNSSTRFLVFLMA